MKLSELQAAVGKYVERIMRDEDLSREDYLEIGRLWNTLAYYTSLREHPDFARFQDLVTRSLMPKMVQALNMKVSRGFAYKSEEFNFTLGGALPETSRYEIEDLEDIEQH